MLVLYGAAAGVADVAMNAQAVVIEQGYGRSVMSSFHGFWSVGGLAGSAVAVLAARAGWTPACISSPPPWSSA